MSIYDSFLWQWLRRVRAGKLWSYASSIGLILLLVYIINRFGTKGLLGLVVAALLFAVYRLITNHNEWLDGKYLLETQIFGKPLKDFEKGEKPVWFYPSRRYRAWQKEQNNQKKT